MPERLQCLPRYVDAPAARKPCSKPVAAMDHHCARADESVEGRLFLPQSSTNGWFGAVKAHTGAGPRSSWPAIFDLQAVDAFFRHAICQNRMSGDYGGSIS